MRQIILMIAVLAASIGTAQGQGSLAELYGMGYHAFFRHDLARAERIFTMAIARGSQDPRAYYFRGLTYDCQGRRIEAEADYRDGAMLEMSGHGERVGYALQRIQGANRIRLERARAEARMARVQPRAVEQPAPSPRQMPLVPQLDRSPVLPPVLDQGHDTRPAPTSPNEPVAPAPIEEPVVPDTTDDENPFGGVAEIDEPTASTDLPDVESAGDDPFGGADDIDENPFDSGELTFE